METSNSAITSENTIDRIYIDVGNRLKEKIKFNYYSRLYFWLVL